MTVPDLLNPMVVSAGGKLFSDGTGRVDERSACVTRTRGQFKSAGTSNHRTRPGNRNSISRGRGGRGGAGGECDRSGRPVVCARRASAAYRGRCARGGGVAGVIPLPTMYECVVRPEPAADDRTLSRARRSMGPSARRIQLARGHARAFEVRRRCGGDRGCRRDVGCASSSRMRSQSAEYAVRNCAAPTNGACIRKVSLSRKCRWSRFFASATHLPSRFPDRAPASMALARFQACAFSISPACWQDRPARGLWPSMALKFFTSEVRSCRQSSRS